VQAELDALDLDTLALGAALGIPLRGAATGTIDLTLSALPAETLGNIDLRIDGLQLGDGKTKIKVPGLPGGITLEAIHAGTLEMKLEVKEGVATISRLEAKGKDIELSGSGSLRVSQSFPDSIADVTLGVKVKDAYAKRNDRTKAMIELMNINLSRFAGADGMIRFHIMGPLSSPRAMPTGPVAAPPAGRKGRKHGG
jgi:type II secretion system protein N